MCLWLCVECVVLMQEEAAGGGGGGGGGGGMEQEKQKTHMAMWGINIHQKL